MSANPTTQFHLRSIVRDGRRYRRGRSKIAEVTINVEETPKKTEPDEEPTTTPTNQLLPGATALNSVILIGFLFYLEQKDHIHFSSTLSVSYPFFVGCEDNKHCVLESKELQLHNTNVTHFFIFILMFVGYVPIHILFLVLVFIVLLLSYV